MAKPKPYKPGPRRLPLELDDEQNLNLHAYCLMTRRGNHSEVVRLALDDFIRRETEGADASRRFDESRRRLAGGDPIRLVPSSEIPNASKKKAK